MSPRRSSVLSCLGALLVLTPASVVAGPEGVAERPGTVEGIVRVGGVPTAAQVEFRRLPVEAPARPGARDAWWEDRDADPAQTGVVDAPPLMTVAADVQGRYRVDGVPSGRYEIRATVASGARAFASLLVEGGRAFVADVAVAPGPRTLRGVVRWVGGAPFRGSVVISQPAEGRRATPWLDGADLLATDVDGRFEARGLLPGRVDVAAVVPGQMRVTWTRRERTTPREVEFTLGRDVLPMEGRVITPVGEPVPDVPLVCITVGGDGTEVAAVARTDREGRFLVRAASGPRRWHVRAPGYLPDQTTEVAGAELTIRLVRAPVVRGLVRRQGDGTPVEGAWTHVTVRSDHGWFVTADRTDAAGRYEIPIPTVGPASVVVQGVRWVGLDPEPEGRSLEADRVYHVNLEAVPAAGRSGLVVFQDGSPAVGAHVELSVGHADKDRSRKQQVLNRLAPIGTDRTGRFVVEGLVPATPVAFSVRHPLSPWKSLAPVVGASVGITLERMPPIVGRIVLPTGARPSDVWLRVTAEAVPAAQGEPTPTPVLDSPPLASLDVACDGSFRIEPTGLAAHRLWAGAWVEGLAYEGTAVGEPGKSEVVLTLSRVEGTPRGWLFRVVGPDGLPVPKGQATLFVGASGFSGFSGFRGRSFEDGEVSFWSDRPGTSASAEVTDFADLAGLPLPYARAETEELPPGVHEIRLQPGRAVRARVRTPDGTPVRRASVAAYRVGPQRRPRQADAWDETDDEGRFVLRYLEPRAYEIEVDAPPGLSQMAPFPAPMGEDDLEITLLPLVAVRVDVRMADGQPVAGARVVVWAPTGQGALATGALDVRTGVDGSVTLAPLPPLESFDMRVDHDGEGTLPFERTGWRPVPTVIVLPRADVLRGVVRSAEGEPVPNATVWIRSIPGVVGGPSPGRHWHRIRDGYVLGALCASDGSFTIGRLLSGEVELFAALVTDDGVVREGPPLRTSTSSREVVLTIP